MMANYFPQIPSKVRKALMDEINKQTAENVEKLSVYISAIVLWSLHEQLGHGKKRLLKFQKDFSPLLKQLQDFYELQNADETEFAILQKLRDEVGIDVETLEQMFVFKPNLRR